MDYCGRFAPSPTGDLHFGSLIAALGSWLCARRAGGRWLVRMDDIDPPREVPGAAQTILAALPAFGLIADEPVLFQSSRRSAYEDALAQLRAADLCFPCWCSRSQLAQAGGLHRDARCVAAPNPRRAPAWRLRVPDVVIDFNDALQGTQRVALRDQAGDFVLRRADGLYGYQLACVVDDAFGGITDVVRGCDLLDSTARQIWLQRSLSLPTPQYAHLPVALDASGHKLAKSSRAAAVDPAHAAATLHKALSWLGVPMESAPRQATAAALLDDALKRFHPSQLPHCSGLVAW